VTGNYDSGTHISQFHDTLNIEPTETSSTDSQPNSLLIAHPIVTPWFNKSKISSYPT